MHILRSLGPAVAHASLAEASRAGIGALLGLAVTGAFLLSPAIDLEMGLFLVAPFGATSVLLFAVPNSPLAQPWSAIVGNTLAAAIGVAVCLMVPDPVMRVALAVGLTISATILCRALHPPAGAVAMTAAMSPDVIGHLGFWFVVAPIALGTTVLVLLAAIYARLTGRRYPFRQFDEPNRHGTQDAKPAERLGLSEAELTGILERYRQSFNLGVEDLARLIGAAELQAATRRTGPLSAEDIMSRNLITVSPTTGFPKIAELFRRHRFTSLPVVGSDCEYLGVIFQIHLIGSRWIDPDGKPALARDIMQLAGPCAAPDTPIALLLPMMAEGEVDAVPILDGNRISGIVTRTDMIAALARSIVRGS
ncbi:HPP family protein [Paracoccus sp. MBLB3053]|uniref:HPP family protein n=1 Tax=Paracoccus aurantius TaxID=3073814 RepID=A0ABU2HUM3_9RHOB|nr:HPP family protein [Paracoccus sp. MBLB3053]MDS9468751.1 HPP family protein [Paracoccus sp. MBLB3053]